MRGWAAAVGWRLRVLMCGIGSARADLPQMSTLSVLISR
jgi:hypothetical protein